MRAYKFRFYPTPEQGAQLLRTWGCVRVVYNKALEERTRAWYDEGKSISYHETSARLTQWKKSEEFAFLNEVPAVPLQQSLRHLQRAFKNFWDKRAKYPRFKSRSRSKLGLSYTRSAFVVKSDSIKLAKHNEALNIVFSRKVDLARATSVTVTRDKAERWFISILVEEEIEAKPRTKKSVGIDLGVKDALVTSTGARYNPTFDIEKKNARIVRAQKELSRKGKGSKNRAKARLKLARAHASLRDAKRDWLHQLTTRLVDEYDVLAIEDLNVSGMTRSVRGRGHAAKAGLNRGILAHNFGEFRELLTYKGQWYGKQIVVIDRFFPSSKRCNNCGYINESLTLKQRQWVCPSCHVSLDRDINAARNILAAGLAVTVCGDEVKPPSSASAQKEGVCQ